MNNQIEEVKQQKETVRILKEQKKISEEVRVKIQEENGILKHRAIKLENELRGLKENLKKVELKNEEIRLIEFKTLYGKKCKKTFYNKLYKIGTPEYKNCILNKGKIN